MQNLSDEEILQLYLENDFDEVISEERINHLLINDSKISKTPPKKEPISQAKNDIVTTATKNNFITPEYSTNNAISKLAKKFTKDNISSIGDADISITAIVKKAQDLAQSATNLAELEKAVKEFDGCNLKKMATNTVFSDGNAKAKIMVIGEAPGNDEDLQGIPFCGESGKLLDQMFGAINMNRQDNIYITNVLFWRPPGNRKPTEEELTICRPFVHRHIQLQKPDILVLVGATAMKAILEINDPISKIRGEFRDYHPKFLDRVIKTFTIFHPSYLLRQSLKKKIAWRDMLALEKFVKEL